MPVQRAVADGWLVRAARGVCALAAVPAGVEQRLLVAQFALGAGSAVSHRGAAFLQELDGVPEAVVELSGPGRRRVPGVLAHLRTRCLEVVERGPLRVTSVRQTLLDLGAVVDVDVVERAVECALRRGEVTDPELRALVDQSARRGWRGPGVLRDALARRPRGARPTGSDVETLALQAMRAGGLPEPVRQHEVRDGAELIAVLDFAWPAARLACEIDGLDTHDGPVKLQYDLTRQNRILARGWDLRRFTSIDVVRRPKLFVRTLRAALPSGRAA